MQKFLTNFLHIILSFLLLMTFLWCELGFFYQLNGFSFWLTSIIWFTLALFVLYSEWQYKAWLSRSIAIIAFLIFAFWWYSIKPSLEDDWNTALQYSATASIKDNTVHIHHIRDFHWHTQQQATEHWIESNFNINQLKKTNLYFSYWMGPYIAHTLIGFEFNNEQELIFSAEIRQKKGQVYSMIGGFFKEFELIIIASTPQDIIRLRTDIRKEQVYRYPLKISTAQAQTLFLNYINKANKLAKTPIFYNTLTTNCTTVIFDVARTLEPTLPMDWRIVLSGQLPHYLYKYGFIDTSLPFNDTVKNAYLLPQNK